jgi:alkylation response protein AidB-like acyl-CoA dehydrogenase
LAKVTDLVTSAEEHGRGLRAVADSGVPGRVNRPLVKALGELGMLRSVFPEDGPVSASTLCALRQGLARSCTEAETALALQGLGTYPVVQSGTAEQIARWVPPVADGDAVAAFALTEPGAGSDVAALELAAEPDGERYRLSGEKTYISNAPEADFYTVFARTGTGRAGISAFIVAGGAPGLGGASIAMLAPHAIGRMWFDGVPAEPLGPSGDGFAVALRTLDLFRPSVGAFAVGMAEAALAMAVEHAKERHAFGRPIAEFQAVSHRIAEMATRTEAARLLVYAAADAYDKRDDAGLTAKAAMAKLAATETAQYVVDGAVQILGARALEETHPLSHLYREVRAPRIYEGTSEIQRNVIAKWVLGDEDGRRKTEATAEPHGQV